MLQEKPDANQKLQGHRIDRVDGYLRVLHALMLRDMRTRFMGSYWGYLFQVLWPVSHVLIIAGFMTFRHLPPGFGESTMLFVATGAVPALTFQYVAREIMKGIMSNRPLTYYPQVRTFDLITSRSIVEILGSFLGLVVIAGIITAAGENVIPTNPIMAIGGYVCSICFGIAVGTINAAIIKFFPGWILGFVLFSIVLYISCGVYQMPSDMPEQIYYYLRWIPLVQIVEWVRLGYDPSLPISIDYMYLLVWILGSLSVGLFLEKTIGRQSS